jgi:hypothetical protein
LGGAEGEVRDPNPESGPALRIFRPGETLAYGLQVLNAKIDSKTKRPAVQFATQLFHDGKQVYSGKPSAVSHQADDKRLSAGGFLRLGAKFAPGEYALQVTATDALAKEQHRTATQWIDFEVR